MVESRAQEQEGIAVEDSTEGVCWRVPGGDLATGVVFAGERSSRSIICLRTLWDGHRELGRHRVLGRGQGT